MSQYSWPHRGTILPALCIALAVSQPVRAQVSSAPARPTAPAAGPLVPAATTTTQPPAAPVADPTDFQGWMARGRHLLVAPGDGENETRRRYDQMFNKPRQAGDAFSRAVELAATDAQRFEALDNAGQAYAKSGPQDKAYAAFKRAREVPGLATADLARVTYEAAVAYNAHDSLRPAAEKQPAEVLAEYDRVLKLPGVPDEYRLLTHKKLATFHMLAKRPLETALQYEHIAQLDKKAPDLALDSAQYYAEQLPPSPTTVALIERLYRHRLTTGKSADTANPQQATSWRRHYRMKWAAALQKQQAHGRAVQEWENLLADPQATATERLEVLQQLAEHHTAQNALPLAVASYARALALPVGTYFSRGKLRRSKAQLHLKQGEYAAARAEFELGAAEAEAKPDDKSEAFWQMGRITMEQAKGATGASQTDLRSTALGQFEAALTVPGQTPAALYSAILQRVQYEVDLGRPGEARAQLARGHELLKSSPPTYRRGLNLAEARVHRLEKNYQAAMDALSRASATQTNWGATVYQPDRPTQDLAMAVFQDTLQHREWEAGRQVVEHLVKWGLLPNTRKLLLAQVEISAANYAAARPLLEELGKASLFGQDKTNYEALKKLLPPA